MSRASDIAWRAKAGEACGVCGADSKGCSLTADGLHLCRGEPADPAAWTMMKDTGHADFRGYRPSDDGRGHLANRASRKVQPPAGGRTGKRDWAAKAATYAGIMKPSEAVWLCRRLGLPDDALAAMPLAGVYGTYLHGPTFVLPECDAAGRVIGLAKRVAGPTARDDEKTFFDGGHRGLTLPAGWRERVGPVLVVEGPSDTLAAHAAGLCVVGRPGNSSGADHLINLFGNANLGTKLEAGRPVLVVGENDRKPDGNWPGRAGAELVARKLAEAGFAARVAFPPPDAKDVRAWLTAPDRGDTAWAARGAELLAHLERSAAPPPRLTADDGDKADGESAANVLLRLGRRHELFRDPAGNTYAAAGRRTLALAAPDFRRHLTGLYLDQTPGQPPPPAAVTAAVAGLDALAARGAVHEVHVRVARHAGRSYLHLADDADTVIEIDAGGWRACDAPPVRFVRRAGMGPLPVPTRGGDLAALRRFVNVPDPGGFAVVLGFLAAAVRGEPPFPALVLTGEASSAKTTTTNVIKGLVDPAADLTAEPDAPADVEDLMVTAAHFAVPAFGNLSGLSKEMSNALARLATGAAQYRRKRYTDAELSAVVACRPVVLNGITDFVTAGDLCSRAAFVRLPPIPDAARRESGGLIEAYRAARPALLGALLDRVAGGLRELPAVELAEAPRMAGFARFATACERAAGEEPRFLAAYADAYADARARSLEALPLVEALVRWFGGRTEWEGTASALLGGLNERVPAPRPDRWPGAANVLSRQLKESAPDLRAVYGLDVDCEAHTGRGDRKARCIRITRVGTVPTLADELAGPGDAFDSIPP